MTIMNDYEISQYGHMIQPFHPSKMQAGNLSWGLSSYGYDVRLGKKGIGYYSSPRTIINPKTFKQEELKPIIHEFDVDKAILEAGGFMLLHTEEVFNLDPDVCAVVRDKSTLARLGIAVQNTVLEPGWRGQLTLEVSNHGDLDIQLSYLMPIAQIQFFKGRRADVPYFGKYQDQEDVTLPKGG